MNTNLEDITILQAKMAASKEEQKDLAVDMETEILIQVLKLWKAIRTLYSQIVGVVIEAMFEEERERQIKALNLGMEWASKPTWTTGYLLLQLWDRLEALRSTKKLLGQLDKGYIDEDLTRPQHQEHKKNKDTVIEARKQGKWLVIQESEWTRMEQKITSCKDVLKPWPITTRSRDAKLQSLSPPLQL